MTAESSAGTPYRRGPGNAFYPDTRATANNDSAQAKQKAIHSPRTSLSLDAHVRRRTTPQAAGVPTRASEHSPHQAGDPTQQMRKIRRRHIVPAVPPAGTVQTVLPWGYSPEEKIWANFPLSNLKCTLIIIMSAHANRILMSAFHCPRVRQRKTTLGHHHRPQYLLSPVP